MKRDMDLVRNILKAIEGSEKALLSRQDFDDVFERTAPDGTEWTNDQILEHIRIMDEHRLVQVKTIYGPLGFSGIRLTGHGHDFIANARNEAVWQKAKSMLGDASLAVLKDGLIRVAKELLLK